MVEAQGADRRGLISWFEVGVMGRGSGERQEWGGERADDRMAVLGDCALGVLK